MIILIDFINHTLNFKNPLIDFIRCNKQRLKTSKVVREGEHF